MTSPQRKRYQRRLERHQAAVAAGETRACATCERVLHASEYYPCASRCKVCYREWVRGKRADHRGAGTVYVVRESSGTYVKIGWGTNVPKRIAELQVGNPRPLTLLAAFEASRDVEKDLHHQLREYRYRGEWFRAVPTVMDAIDAARDQAGTS